MYLIYETEQEAWDRSEQEAILRNHAFHIVGRGTRYVTAPVETTDGDFALDVSGYKLTAEEQSSAVDSFDQLLNELPTIEDDR